MTNVKPAYTFDDLMLVPQHSEIRSRRDPDLKVRAGRTTLRMPVFASPMNTVTEFEMVRTMGRLGGAGVLHRYMSIERQVEIVKELQAWGSLDNLGFPQYVAEAVEAIWVAVGANGDAETRVARLLEAGQFRFCVDVANGHSVHCLEAVRMIRAMSPEAVIMAGNVCTYDGTAKLATAGANLIRVGIGPGAVCTTRIVTGHGIPQLTAIEECASCVHGLPDVGIVADGGIRSSGDIVKALAMGADYVMLGSLLAGTSDTPGDTHKHPDTGMLYKYYHGMASMAGRDGWFDRSQTGYVPEGESTKIPYKGDTERVIEGLMGGVRVGMSYSGAANLQQLRAKAEWRQVTTAGAIEGTPHGKRR